jgi:hypothetical protein
MRFASRLPPRPQLDAFCRRHGIDADIVWQVATRNIPDLIARLQPANSTPPATE